MITFLLFTEEYTSKLPKHNLLLLPLRATKKKRDKNKFRATNFSACLNFVQRRKQFDAITTGNRVIGILSSQDGNAKEDFD